MRTRALAPLATLLSLLSVCAAARPASAQVYLRMDASNQVNGTYVKELRAEVGQRVFLRLTALNTANVPLACVCEVPMLKVRVGNTLQAYRVRSVLLPGKQGSTTIAAVATSKGTFKMATVLLWQNPYTGAVNEVVDNVLLIAGVDDKDKDNGGTLGGDKDKDNGGTLGGDKDKDNGGTLGGQQTGGTGGQQTGGTGGQQTGGTGGQQTGGTGGQQTGGTGGQQNGGTLGGQTGGTGGQTGGTGQQQQQGGKKDDTGTGSGVDYRF